MSKCFAVAYQNTRVQNPRKLKESSCSSFVCMYTILVDPIMGSYHPPVCINFYVHHGNDANFNSGHYDEQIMSHFGIYLIGLSMN